MKNIEIIESKKIIDYKVAINYMEEKLLAIKNNTTKELIWFLEHPSIYTSGRGNPVNKSYIDEITIYNSERGGKITWHGPGQRIIYFIIDLKKRGLDIRRFVSNVEKFIIKSLLELDIKAYKKNNIVGIWTLDKEKKEAKIGSLGLRVSKGIIYHGLSLNVSCDLSNFYRIDPCGIKNSRVTSVKNLKNLINKNEVDKVLKRKLKVLFN
jgi:lipoyl(octanoyl) transferase